MYVIEKMSNCNDVLDANWIENQENVCRFCLNCENLNPIYKKTGLCVESDFSNDEIKFFSDKNYINVKYF